jgi:3-methylfumaryl-CoA hydratase
MVSVEKPFADWIGRRSASEDIVTQRLVDSYRAILDPCLAPVADGHAPLGLHWCLSPAIEPMAALGPDGHPAKNLSLPPVPLPRRMWAGGSVELIAPIEIGDHVHRISTIADVVHKTGRSGELWFVTVDHDYLTPRGVAIRERQDIVYRQAAGLAKTPQTTPAPGAPRPSTRSWTIETPSTLLFRYSAITFNGHRIHYDMPYATGAEGYDGLVVHGPMQATMLLNLAASNARPLRSFDYRGVAPAIAGNALTICADDTTGELWTKGPDGTIHMDAKASY